MSAMPTADLRLLPIAPTASTEEAAAIAAALETFIRATAPAQQTPAPAIDRWSRAALLEGVEREPDIGAPHPWINT